MNDIEATLLLLSEKEAEYALTLNPGEFWTWWASDREVPLDPAAPTILERWHALHP